MKKENEAPPEVNAFINDELSAGSASGGDKDKKVVKSLLKIPYNHTQAGSVTLFIDNIYFASTRLNTLIQIEEDFEVDVTGRSDLAGKKYQLILPVSRKILQQGKIAAKSAASNVIDLPAKTGTDKK